MLGHYTTWAQIGYVAQRLFCIFLIHRRQTSAFFVLCVSLQTNQRVHYDSIPPSQVFYCRREVLCRVTRKDCKNWGAL